MTNGTMSKIKRTDRSAWFLTPFLSLILNPTNVLAQAYNYSTVDGAGGTGTFVGSGMSFSNTNFTNFTTRGGAGSGGGGGLGGVFFVDQNATLNLNNVQLSGNVARGGTGGSVAQIALSNLSVNLINQSTDITAITAPGGTPALTRDIDGTYFVTGMTMAGANSLIAAGANASFGSATLSNGTIASVDGTTVVFTNPVQVNASAVKNLVGTSSLGSTTIILTTPTYGTADIAVGMAVYGANFAPGTKIASTTLDSNNKVSAVTLSAPPIGGTSFNFDAIGVTSFDATRFTASGNQITPTSQMAGIQVGMTVTGNGIASGTTITAIASNGVITLSQPVTGTPTAFTVSSTAAVTGSNVITLPSVRSDLVVGMKVSGTGIAANTTIVAVNGASLTLSSQVTSGTVAAVAAGNMILSASPVISSGGNTLTLSSVAGLKVGALLKGTDVPANAVISNINTATKVVTYRIDANAASLTTGGAMNGRTATGTVGSTGNNGLAGSMYSAILHDGEGSPGTNAYNAGNGNGAAGGVGGNGGDGSRGLPYNLDAMAAVTSSTLGALKDTLEAVAEGTPDPLPKPSAAAAKTGAIVMAWYDVAVATADLIKWQVDLGMGLVAHGGDGGSGGSGGDGSAFFGGGAGGKGGNGGTGATPITDGGAGGDGGSGGAGGFGAGGGAGGKGGDGGSNGSSVKGAAGDGGEAGFGAGGGSDGNGKGGGGGSGFGGAIFVRNGGTLSITGNALFENNGVLAGSSTNGGSAGESAGTDLFMMKGSNVTLSPGAGKTITFRGTIADDSSASMGGQWASGEGADIQITGGGLVQFEGANSYTGRTMIGGATLQAIDGDTIHTDSQIWFNGGGTIGQSLSDANAGVLLTSGDFNRRVGDLPNQVFWAGSGGFAAEEGGLTLNFGAIGSTARQTLVWDSNGFVPDGKTLVFGSAFGTGVVTLVNDVNLNTKTGRIAVYDNPDVTTDYVVLQGNFTNGSLIFNSAGYGGTTYMTGLSSLTNMTVQNGTIDTQYEDVIGRLFDPTIGGNLTVTGGTVKLRSAEKINALNVSALANLYTYDAITAGNIINGGSLTLNGGLTANDVTNGLTGTLKFAGETAVRDITNSGRMEIAAATSARNIVNNVRQSDGGIMMMTGDVTASGTVANYGVLGLAANLTVGSTVTNNGVLSVLGDFQGTNAEVAPATRTIITTGFNGSGVVNLGGATALVPNTLNLDQSGASTFTGFFTGAGALVKQGDGTLTLTSALNDFTGGLTVAAGGIDTTGGGNLADTLAVSVAQGATYTVGTTDTIASLSNAGATGISAGQWLTLTGDLINRGTGTLTVDGSLTVGGHTSNMLGGVIDINSGASAYLAGNLGNPGTINNRGYLSVAGITTNTSLHTLNMMSGSTTLLASLINTGNVVGNGSSFTVTNGVTNGATGLNGLTGAMTLNAGTNVFGTLTNNAGTINVGSSGGTLAVTGAYVQNGGSLTTTTSISTGSLSGAGGVITLTGLTTALNLNQTANGTYSGSITGTGSVNKNGSGTLTLNGAANSFSPTALFINAGGVAVNGAGILASALRVNISSGANLTLVSGDQSINNLNGSGTLNLNANNLTLANGGNFLGNVTGSGAVRVSSGAFSVAAGGSMGTSGVMNVTGNTSILNAAGALTADVLNVNGGGTLHLGALGGSGGTIDTNTMVVSGGGSLTGVGTIAGMNGGRSSTIIGLNGFLAPGNSPGVLTVDNLVLDTGSTTNMQAAGLGAPGTSGGYDQVVINGAMTLKPGSTLNLQKVGFEFGLAQKAQMFAFTPGAVSGNWGTVTSNFTNKVIYNVPTGTVIGLGDYTAASFTTAITGTANQASIEKALMVNNTGGVNQYYGGRLMEYVTTALAPASGTTVAKAFDRWSPEAYTGMMDHMTFSMLNSMPELGGYTSLANGKYSPYGSLARLGQETQHSTGYVVSKFTSTNVNVGMSQQTQAGQFSIGYAHSDGRTESNYMKGSATGEKVMAGASIPFAYADNLRATARVMYGFYTMSGTRETNLGNAAYGSLRGNTAVFGPGLEYVKSFDGMKLTATTELLGIKQHMQGFTETGVSALDAMSVRDQSGSAVVMKNDLRLGYALGQDSLGYVKLGLQQQLGKNMHTLTANAKSDAVSFTVQNPGLAATQLTVGMGANVYLTKKALLSMDLAAGTGGMSSVDMSFKYILD